MDETIEQSLTRRLMPPFPLEETTSEEEEIYGPIVSDTNSNEDDDPSVVLEKLGEILMLKGLFGKPYSRSMNFWLLEIPLAILIGLVGVTSALIYSGGTHRLGLLWINGLLPSGEKWGPQYTDEDDVGKVSVKCLTHAGYNEGTYNWLIVMVAGSFLAAMPFLLPGAPDKITRNMLKDLSTLNPDRKQGIYLILHMFLSVAVGASVGTEAAIIIIGSETGLRISDLFGFDSYRRVLMILTGMTCTLGGILGGPLLGILATVELTLTGRPGDVRLKSVANKLDGTDKSMKSRHPLDVDVNDFMHQLVVTGIAGTVSYVIFFLAVDYGMPHIRQPDFYGIMSEAFRVEHILCAVPLGMLCGIIGFLHFVVRGIATRINVLTGERMASRGFPAYVHPPLIMAFSGLLAGLIAKAYPLTLGTGGAFMYQLFILGIGDPETASDPGVENGDEGFLSPSYLLQTAILNLIVTSIWMGLGGVRGGMMMPFIASGTMIGLALPEYLPFYMPACISVPCCMISIATSIMPFPLTISLTLIVFLSLPGYVGTCMFISTISAHSLHAGLGLLPALAERRFRKIYGASPLFNGDYFNNDAFSITSSTDSSSGRRLMDEEVSEEGDFFR